MHHTQAQFIGTQFPFGNNLNTGTYGISNIGLSSVNPLTGQYFVQLIPTTSALNNNVEGTFVHPAFFANSVFPTPAFAGLINPLSSLTNPLGSTVSLNPSLNYGQLWNTPFNTSPHAIPSTGWMQGLGTQLGNVVGTGNNPFQNPAVFITPTAWQNVTAWNSTGQTLTSTGAAVRYIQDDTETVIEISIPGVNTENLELVSIGGEIRIRPTGGRSQGGFELQQNGYLSVALPVYSDGSQIQAQAAGDFLRIIVPTRKEIASQIKKIKPSRVK